MLKFKKTKWAGFKFTPEQKEAQQIWQMELGTWLSEGKVSIEEVDKLCDQS